MFDQPLVFVDVETTGGRADRERIIEVGIAVINHGQIETTYSQLFNPQTSIPPFISQLTGITNQHVKNAPEFSEHAEHIQQLLQSGLFIAHNARFDYSFLQAELGRVGFTLPYKYLCTVKLARHLIPELSKYNLDTLIQYCGLQCSNRHRALDDASVLWQFLQWASNQFSPQTIQTAIQQLTKSIAIPKHLDPDSLENIPNQPGIYYFHGADDSPLYIGKSIRLKDRVRSHFTTSANLKDQQLYQQTQRISYQTTAGELGALLRESQAIKSQLPLYNRQLRHPKLLTALLQTTTTDGYHTVRIERIKQIDPSQLNDLLGIFKSPSQAKQKITKLAKLNQLCPQLLGIDPPSSTGCFYRHIDKCYGACLGQESPHEYNQRFLDTFHKHRVVDWPFNQPIIFTEKSTDWTEQHLIHQWIYLGSLTTDNHHNTVNPQFTNNPIFDWDTYKILVKFLNQPHYQAHVTQISQQQLHQLFDTHM